MPTRKANSINLSVTAVSVAAVAMLLTACSGSKNYQDTRYSQKHDSAPYRSIDVSQVKDAIPRAEPKSRYGNPPSYVVRGKRYYTLSSGEGYSERGIASWYGTKFHGHRTSSGDTYDMYQMSAAHKTLPLPSYAQVTNLRNGKSVIVKINDRGPFHDNRLIDLSYAAASRLGILGNGTGLVEVSVIDPRTYLAGRAKKRGIPASKPKLGPRSTAAVTEAGHEPLMYLQLGAFSSRSNAERLKARLSSSELPGKLHISEGLSNRQPIYRVRIGPLANVETADQLTLLLADKGIPPPRVVVD